MHEINELQRNYNRAPHHGHRTTAKSSEHLVAARSNEMSFVHYPIVPIETHSVVYFFALVDLVGCFRWCAAAGRPHGRHRFRPVNAPRMCADCCLRRARACDSTRAALAFVRGRAHALCSVLQAVLT